MADAQTFRKRRIKCYKAQKDKLQKTTALKDAFLNYMGTAGCIHGKLAEMLGELVYEERAINHQIDKLIEDQAAQE